MHIDYESNSFFTIDFKKNSSETDISLNSPEMDIQI